MALVTVAADKRHLVQPGGQPYFILGVNYIGYFDRAWKMWDPDYFDPALITRDFRKTQNSGFNTIRLFIHPTLEQDLKQNNFDKLDQTLSLAQDHNLKVILTLNETHTLHLEQVSQLDTRLASRYKGVPTILAYDLQNKPVFHDLAAAIYPPGYQAALQTSQLIDHYGVRVNREETHTLQQNHHIPPHLNPDHAFYYINALRLFIEYDQAINRFITSGRGTILDFLLSPEATPWHTLISVLDSTLETWLRARIDPLRGTPSGPETLLPPSETGGASQLLTVGWSWPHFATLPANRALDFQQYHHFAEPTLIGFNTLVAHLNGLQRAFPRHPLVLGEFGWSNQSTTNPATSQPVPAGLTALYEAACYAYLRAAGHAGGLKWVLNDIQLDHNPHDANLGVFQPGDQPKPIRELLHHLSQTWPPATLDQPAAFTPVGDLETGLAYRFETPHQIIIGGHSYQDRSLTWRAAGIAGHCLINRSNHQLTIDTLSPGQLSLVPWELLPTWNQARETDLYRVFADNHRSRQRTFPVGETVTLDVTPGARYTLIMGKEGQLNLASDDLPRIEPKPGEHVLLLGDSTHYLPAALKYIRRFNPDLTFAPAEIDGRWAYISVIATSQQIPDDHLDAIRSVGAILVERLIAPTPQATQTLLDQMAGRGQRFLVPPSGGQGGPPSGGPDSYIIQPGDTLSHIAQKYYGHAHLWPLIFEANRDKLTNPNQIPVGIQLQIPER